MMMTRAGLLYGCGVFASVAGFIFENRVCYDGVGCFQATHPFHNALGELPDSPDKVKPRMYLWTRLNPVQTQELSYTNLTTISSSNFSPSRPTKILIHGYMTSLNASASTANLSVAFLQQGDYNVIGVDWSAGAHAFYPKAVANTRLVGAVVANLVLALQTKFDMKLDDLHLVGHSLGAHTVGYVGRRIPGIARITGLDPAGPMFSKSDTVVRLDQTDARFVDVIHSDAAPLTDAGFGTMQTLGDQDFYPNGGQQQPGCPPPIKTTAEELIRGQLEVAFDDVSCGHDRAIWYFIESVSNDACQFVAHPCQSWMEFSKGQCSTCGNSTCPSMGINSIQSEARGTFYLETNAESPFCKQSASKK